MTFKFGIRPSLAFRGLQRYKQPAKIGHQSLIRFQQTRALENAEVRPYNGYPRSEGTAFRWDAIRLRP